MALTKRLDEALQKHLEDVKNDLSNKMFPPFPRIGEEITRNTTSDRVRQDLWKQISKVKYDINSFEQEYPTTTTQVVEKPKHSEAELELLDLLDALKTLKMTPADFVKNLGIVMNVGMPSILKLLEDVARREAKMMTTIDALIERVSELELQNVAAANPNYGRF